MNADEPSSSPPRPAAPDVQSVRWLQGKLRRAGTRWRATEGAAFAGMAAGAVVWSLALYALADYAVHFPQAVRIVVSLALVAAGALLARRQARRWLPGRRSADEVARRIEQVQARAGASQQSLIVAALEFGERPAIPGAAELKNVTIDRARGGCVDPAAVRLHEPRHTRWGLRVAGTAAIALALWTLLAGDRLPIFLKRALGLDVRYPTATRVVRVNWQPVAPSRQDYPIAMLVDGKRPASGTLSVHYAGQRPFDAPIQPVTNGQYAATVAGPDRPFTFSFVLGDYESDRYAVDVRVPPLVKEGVVKVAPPAYTRMPPFEAPFGNLTVPEGSRLSVAVTPTRRVVVCRLLVGTNAVPMAAAAGGAAYTAVVTVAEAAPFSVRMRDAEGIENNDAIPYYLNVVKDAPPKIEISRPKPNGFISDVSVLRVEAEIKDDYGVKDAQLLYEIYQKQEIGERVVAKKAVPLPLGAQGKIERVQLTRLAREFQVRPDQRLMLRIVATDQRGDPAGRGQSDELPITVVSAAELRRILEDEQAHTAAMMRKLRDDEKQEAEAIARRLKAPAS